MDNKTRPFTKQHSSIKSGKYSHHLQSEGQRKGNLPCNRVSKQFPFDKVVPVRTAGFVNSYLGGRDCSPGYERQK